MLYELDPGLPASSAILGTAPGIQLDSGGGILAMRLAGSGQILRRGYGKSQLIPNGLDGHPIIHTPAGGTPGGWESFVFDPEAADSLFARSKQPFTVALVARRTLSASCDVVKVYAQGGAHATLSENPDGRLAIGQNDGRGTATESEAGPLNRWDIIYYIYDGDRAWLLRNGERTAITPAFTSGGFGEHGIEVFQLLNGCAMDVAWLGIADQAPGVSQINAETERLRTLFPSVAPQDNVVANARATAMPRFMPDRQSRFLTRPNNPSPDPLPIIESAVPGDGLVMSAGAQNAFSLIMGTAQPGANMRTSESIRDRFYLNYMVGNLNQAIGSPMDTGQANNNTFAAVARHSKAGDSNDLHVMAADGMHLRAICSHENSDCQPGHVWGAMVRLPFEWRPGMTLKVRYRSPKGSHSWAPIWMFSGQQKSPGMSGDAYRDSKTPNVLYRAGKNFEIDWNDNYSRARSGVQTGYQIDFGTPDIYGIQWQQKPHGIYWANGNGWKYHDSSAKPEFEETPFDWSADFHNLVGNWRNDGSNLIDIFVDGKLVVTSYMEYPQDSYVDPADDKRKTVAMHLIIGNQAVPSFSSNPASVKDNDGIPDGWTIVIQEISGWYGTIADPDRYRAAPGNGLK